MINVLNVLIPVLHEISHPPFPPKDDEEEFDIGQSMTLDDQYNFDSTLYCSAQASHQLGGESSESTTARFSETPLITSHHTFPLLSLRLAQMQMIISFKLIIYMITRLLEIGN